MINNNIFPIPIARVISLKVNVRGLNAVFFKHQRITLERKTAGRDDKSPFIASRISERNCMGHNLLLGTKSAILIMNAE
ncbi:hypothetical protein OUHCRE11_11570 [Enterobacter asburiae]